VEFFCGVYVCECGCCGFVGVKLFWWGLSWFEMRNTEVGRALTILGREFGKDFYLFK